MNVLLNYKTKTFIDGDKNMVTTTVSKKYQVVIPRDVREHLKLYPGKKYQVMAYGDCIELVPIRKARTLKDAFKGLDSRIDREKDRL